MWMEAVDTEHSNSTQTAPFPCRDGERHEKILSNQAGSEFNDVSTYPASSAPCPLTSSQNVSALSRIDKGPAHHGSPTLSSRYLSHQTPWSSISRRPAASQVLELTRESLNRSNRTFPAWSAHLLCALVKKVIVLQAQLPSQTRWIEIQFAGLSSPSALIASRSIATRMAMFTSSILLSVAYLEVEEGPRDLWQRDRSRREK